MTSAQAPTPGSFASNTGMPPDPFDRRWFVHLGDKNFQPFTGHEIQEMVRQRKIIGVTLVYPEGGSAWTQLGNDPILGTLFKSLDETNRTLWRRPSDAKALSRFRAKLLFGVLLAAIIGWITWPYYAAYQLAVAVRDGDIPNLESLVAWDSVRQGLRDDLHASFLKSVNADAKKLKANEPGSAIGAGLAVVFGPALIDRIIDSYVTPQAIANFNRSKNADALSADNPEASPKTFSETVQAARQIHWRQVQYAFFAGGPLSFEIDLVPQHNPPIKNPVVLIFKWAGNWRLTRIILPRDAMDGFSVPTNNGTSLTAKTQIDSSKVAAAPQPNAPQASAESKDLTPLNITLVSKGFKDKNIQAGDFEDDITFSLAIKNIAERDIRAFDGVLTFTDLLDNEIMSLKLAINEPVRAGTTLNWKGAIKYNQFMDANQRLRSARQENLKLKFTPRKFLFKDGSVEEYGDH